MKISFFKHWWLITLKGIFMIALGSLLLVHPYVTTQAIAAFLGVTLLAIGMSVSWFAISNQQITNSWKWFLAEGVLELVTGLLLLFHQEISMDVITLLLSLWILILGVFQLVFGFQFRKKLNGWKNNIVYGILSILIGSAIVINPMNKLIGFIFIFGITLLLFGLSFIGTSKRMQKHYKKTVS